MGKTPERPEQTISEVSTEVYNKSQYEWCNLTYTGQNKNGRHCADDTFKRNSLKMNRPTYVLIRTYLK